MDAYAVVLYFDEKATKMLSSTIQAVAEKTGNRYMLEKRIPPHVTIGAFESDECEQLAARVGAFAAEQQPITVRFQGVGVFAPRVVFAAPEKDAALAGMNERLHESLQDAYSPADHAYYTPKWWMPHCALAVRLDEAQFAQAREIAQAAVLPSVARAEKIVLARCNPYTEIAGWRLGKTE